MTSEIDSLKTNEIVRRRKLRLQQVREQSKDIAKKIRQRTKVEKLNQVVDLDIKKQRDYFNQKEQLVKRLEEFYAQGINHIGTSHKTASELNEGKVAVKADPSKQRGREAAAELRKKRQEKLDLQKKILDRKLQAREAANEASREKSASIAQKLSKTSNKDIEVQNNIGPFETNKNEKIETTCPEVRSNEMATQKDCEPLEWEPNVPLLSLPQDEKDSAIETNNNIDTKSDKSKHLDLFALSEEMPSSLRGGLSNKEPRAPVKPSVTLVSDYLQNRGLRLRENSVHPKKKNTDELRNIKQTILRSRASKPGSACLCLVHDEEIMPVPTWRPENKCGVCCHDLHETFNPSRTCCSVHMNIFGPTKPFQTDLLTSPALKGCTPFRRNMTMRTCSAGASGDKLPKTPGSSAANKKNVVTMYNHSSRNTRDIQHNDDMLVVRDLQNNDDAYSLAMKESSVENTQKNKLKKMADSRSKIAMSKQQVEKEYRDTISFLNSLPKDSGDKPIRRAFMDEDRQQSLIDNRQQKLQREYNNIVKDCKKPNCRHKTKSRSPAKNIDIDLTDLQYSWMPVPEEDGNLAIHTIPTSFKESKSGNTVKFSKIDSYHEYRSRHKHTPPTKDPSQAPKRNTEPAIMQNTSAETTSDSSSEIISLETKDKKTNDDKVSDAERIIIYKILDAQHEKKNEKIMKNIAKSLSLLSQKTKHRNESPKNDAKKNRGKPDNAFSFEEIKEGLYEAVSPNGTGDNITSMYFSKNGDDAVGVASEEEIRTRNSCRCNKTKNAEQCKKCATSFSPQWELGDTTQNERPSKKCTSCGLKCACKDVHEQGTNIKSSIVPSKSTAAGNDNASAAVPEGFIKLLGDGGEETGKLFVGASGFLKDDAYEVVIQLRKKGDEKDSARESSSKASTTNDNPGATVLPETAEIVDNAQLTEEISSDTDKETNTPNNVIYTSEFAVNHVTNIEKKDKSSQSKDYAEKGIGTSSQESFVDINLLRTESSRPVTSAYTQTSLSTPSHRPVLLHMSSTTSTAYMSPPEMIFPNFINRDYMSDEDIFEHEQFEANHGVPMYAKEDKCRCKKCCHARNVACRTSKRCSKTKHKTYETNTPPNTVRSNQCIVTPFVDFNKPSKRKLCSCSKCQSINTHKTPSSTSLKHMVMSKPIIPSITNNKKEKSRLNPTIREYVNKLLQLNKASHKAIQVIDQDCSNISTPSSSVINVSSNNNHRTIGIENKISLDQIKTIMAEKILRENHTKIKPVQTDSRCFDYKRDYCTQSIKQPRFIRKKTAHKVKSLNISKNLFKPKPAHKALQTKQTLIVDSNKGELTKDPTRDTKRNRSKSSPTPRSVSANPKERSIVPDSTSKAPSKYTTSTKYVDPPTVSTCRAATSTTCRAATSTSKPQIHNRFDKGLNSVFFPDSTGRRAAATTSTSNLQIPGVCDTKDLKTPSNISTQTIDSEINFYKFDEDKIQNMGKIADLTEKCTKRLSNLAKVLEEVRRSKSLAYSQISTSDDSDQKSDKNYQNVPAAPLQSFHDSQKSVESNLPEENIIPAHISNEEDSEAFVPFLNNIPKPDLYKVPNLDLSFSSNSSNKSNPSNTANENSDNFVKPRAKPPPALSRVHLKHVQDYLIPHELSTVVEVDSPMSVKARSQTSRNDTKIESTEIMKQIDNITYKADRISNDRDPELSRSTVNIPPDLKISHTVVKTESSMDSKNQMIDINQFNEIMLKPYYSLQEYAKNNNVVSVLEDGSNVEDFGKSDMVVDEISSLHSDASLPDVISELLKRNIISEPFKFDTGSNHQSTTVSSESSMSVLALSKMRKKERKTGIMIRNKENVVETSDTLSISSNPDLENAFKKMGMGWASSTLKKTKERLALSSSTNTSSSSLTHFKLKSLNPDVPVLVNDSKPSPHNSKKPHSIRNNLDVSKNAVQQTSVTASMINVKEFLNNELSKKITFTNKSRNRNETEDEFVSLFETKMPDDFKQTSRVVREDTVDISIRSNNRARTSTPVQLYKSMTFQSTSSSNISNGLFSNADDLSSVKHTSNSLKNHSASEKDDLTIPNLSLRVNKNGFSE